MESGQALAPSVTCTKVPDNAYSSTFEAVFRQIEYCHLLFTGYPDLCNNLPDSSLSHKGNNSVVFIPSKCLSASFGLRIV